MEEIAATMEAAHLPGGFHRAAAEIFCRTSQGRQEAGGEAGVEQIVAALIGA